MAELAPPRKSVELEDPGAHELGMHNTFTVGMLLVTNQALKEFPEQSENDSDVFADAQEGHQPSSGSNSPIPTTRVEKVRIAIPHPMLKS